MLRRRSGDAALDDPVGGSRSEFADMFSCPATPPSDWEPVFVLEGRQMVRPGSGPPVRAGLAIDADVIELGAADVAEANTGAIALYERLGFESRKHVTFRGLRTP